MKGIYPYYQVEPIETLRDMLEGSCRRYSLRVALQGKVQGKYQPLAYAQLRPRISETAAGLESLGMIPGSKVAILGENSPEWALAYLAVTCSGAICVPIDKDLKIQEIQHILEFSEVETVIAGRSYLEGLRQIQSRLPALRQIICFETVHQESGVLSYNQLQARGRRVIEQGKELFRSAAIQPDQLAAIIFTSGTMGNPKGVMLTHRNICSNMMDTCRSVYIDQNDHFLSVLPLHHTYECTAGLLIPLYRGATVSYCENLRRIAENMAEVRATVVLGVPLLFEAIYRRIREGIRAKGDLKFTAALRVASLIERAGVRSIRKRLFSPVHQKLGGRLRLLICGGAAVNPEVAKGFRQLGIHFVQGYGMTEASPIIAVNRDRAFRDAAAGLPLAGVEVRTEDGEILARGDNVMQGYFKNPEATAITLAEGWLHTGDLGELDSEGFLHISGRKKSVIVTSGGKKIYPEEVEIELMQCPLVAECIVCEGYDPGNGESLVRAVIVPNLEAVSKQLGKPESAISDSEMYSVMQTEVRRVCKSLASFKQIRQIDVQREELVKTTTRKVKRYLYVQAPPTRSIPT